MRMCVVPGVLAAVVALGLAGCDQEPAPVDFKRADARIAAGLPDAPTDRYALANGCFLLRANATRSFVTSAAGGSYAASTTALVAGEKFFLKATGLGSYLLYARDGSFLATGGGAVQRATAASSAAEWEIDTDGRGNFSLRSLADGAQLSVEPGTRRLVLGSAGTGAGEFSFRPAWRCARYPEIEVNARGLAFRGKPNAPVLGFADVHLHVSATTFLGGAHHGAPFHRFGVTHALSDCAVLHGEDGRADFVGNLYGGNPLSTHDTQGWPGFGDWPHRSSLTHEQVYYKWLERAWKAGLRIVVNDLVENETLCSLNRNARANPLLNCNEMDNARAQIQVMRDLEAYVDADRGGPGKGWLRIVTSPEEARGVIRQGKLAVVLGIEISHLFDCDLKRVAGVETVGCTQESIDAQLDELHALGVRQMFPVHEFDNAFGGNGIFDGTILNLGNRYDTGEFWSTYDCPNGGGGDTYFYGAGAIMTGLPPPSVNPILTELLSVADGQLPLYGPARQCNARAITPLGSYAIGRMMDKGIIIEVDHLELSIKDEVIALAAARTPAYPLVSTHGGHGGISMEQARRILELGGIIYPMHPNGRGFVSMLEKLSPLAHHSPYFALGYGADTNGMASQSGPRGGTFTRVSYPFTLFSGPDWGPEFAGVPPVTFDQQVSGERRYDTDIDGMAHYGMIADWVEEVRIEGHREGQPNEAIRQLFRSAEGYLQMWERTVER